jgi:hypothetical protein
MIIFPDALRAVMLCSVLIANGAQHYPELLKKTIKPKGPREVYSCENSKCNKLYRP